MFEIQLRVSVVQSILLIPFVHTRRDFQAIAVSWWYISDAKLFFRTLRNATRKSNPGILHLSRRWCRFSITQGRRPALHHGLWEETVKGHTVISCNFRFQKRPVSPLDYVQFYCGPHIFVCFPGFSGSSTQLHSTHGPLLGWNLDAPCCFAILFTIWP